MRTLLNGEMLREGDEYTRRDGEIRTTRCAGQVIGSRGVTMYTYRRKETMKKNAIVTLGSNEAIHKAVEVATGIAIASNKCRATGIQKGYTILVVNGKFGGQAGDAAQWYPVVTYPLATYPRFDARTELGKLVDYLSDKTWQIGEWAASINDDGSLQVGCTKIEAALVKEIAGAL